MADLDELDRCRLCSSQNNLTDVFGVPSKDELFRMIYACTSIRISFERDFPCAVCTSCIRIVKQFYSYRQKCLDHDRNLKRLRGEEDDEGEGGDVEGGELDGNDPLKGAAKKRKQEREAMDKKFYEDVRKQIESFLAKEVKEVERKALERVNEALKKRMSGAGGKPEGTEQVLLQMTVEPADGICEEVEYEVLNDSEGYKMELESVYFATSDNEEERAETSGFVGFDERNQLKGAAAAVDVKRVAVVQKRKLSSEDAVVTTQTKMLEQQLTEAQKKIDTLTQLSYELELKRMRIENGGGVVSTRFTTDDEIPITLQELEIMNEKSASDSVFVGMLITRLVDPNKLKNMSVTGHASPRFAKLKKPDGTPLYPPGEKIDPRIFDFVCNKVAERTAMRIGPDDIHTIRKNSEERIIKKFIAQKIGNLRKADIVKRSRAEGEPPAWSETSSTE